MYQYFIYFIIVVIIYSTYEPSRVETMSWGWSLLGQSLLFAIFALACRILFRRLENKSVRQILPESLLQKRHQALIARLTFAAIAFFATNIYFFNLKFYVLQLPFLKNYSSLSALPALAIFILYLVVIWLSAFSSASRLLAKKLSRLQYVANRLRLSFSILLPWLLVTFLFDLVEPIAIPVLSSYSPFAREVVLFSIFLAGMVIMGPLLLRVFWNLQSLPAGPDRAVIERICKRLKFKYRDIMLWPIFEGEMLTAGVMGLVSRFRYLMISPSLLNILVPEEIEAVIGHEIGHIRKYHLVYFGLFFLGYLIFLYPAFDLVYLLALSSETFHYLVTISPNRVTTVLSLFTAVPMVILFIIYFRFIFGYFIRNFERQADLFSLEVTGNAQPLANSLEKIAYYSGNIRSAPSWHHFSIAERVAFLYEGANHPELIKRHHRKLKIALTCYILALAVMGYAGFSTHFFDLNNRLELHLAKKVLTRQVKDNPMNKDLWFALANLYYEAKEYAEAIQGYQRVVTIDPENAEALNNLAWLYATCPTANYCKPKEALSLAQRAALLKKEPHILDTLAESYYRNGRYDEAFETIQQAIALKPEDLKYYQEQLDKFKRAVDAAKKTTRGISSKGRLLWMT
jgi:Zn-dependent protease with chaperone function